MTFGIRLTFLNHFTRMIHYGWLQCINKLSVAISKFGDLSEMVGVWGFHRRWGFGASDGFSANIIACMVGLFLAPGAMEASAAQAAHAGAIQTASNLGDAVRDLGVLPPPPDADNPTPTSPSAATVSSAQRAPELPIWAMLLLFFGGLGLAKLKKAVRTGSLRGLIRRSKFELKSLKYVGGHSPGKPVSATAAR
jgi:hypothetical protein